MSKFAAYDYYLKRSLGHPTNQSPRTNESENKLIIQKATNLIINWTSNEISDNSIAITWFELSIVKLFWIIQLLPQHENISDDFKGERSENHLSRNF